MTSHRARIPGPAVLAIRRRELLLEEECAAAAEGEEGKSRQNTNCTQAERVVFQVASRRISAPSSCGHSGAVYSFLALKLKD